MVQLVFFLLLGALLFVVLFVLARRGKAEGGARALVGARQALFTLQMELLPSVLVARFFAREDLDFIQAHGTPVIESMFREERKRLALIWVDRVRNQVQLLRHLHLGSARFYARLDFKTELALAWDFTVLSVSCRTLAILFRLGGPYAAPKMVGAVADAAGRICEISRQSLAFLLGSDWDRSGGSSVGGPAI